MVELKAGRVGVTVAQEGVVTLSQVFIYPQSPFHLYRVKGAHSLCEFKAIQFMI